MKFDSIKCLKIYYFIRIPLRDQCAFFVQCREPLVHVNRQRRRGTEESATAAIYEVSTSRDTNPIELIKTPDARRIIDQVAML